MLQILVHESDRHASFADCGRYAFHLARPHIAAREDAGNARLEDAALHPSGAISAVLVDGEFSIWTARLSPRLVMLDLQRLSDPQIANDPFPEVGTPPADVTANSLPQDSVHVAPDGEEAVVAVVTPLDSVLLYRVAFTTRWVSPRRALVLPVSPHAAFLPIGGSFDTFGAMWSSYRTLVDVDGDGNAYLAFWAYPGMIQQHVAFVGDGLRPLAASPFSRDSDVLLEKFDREAAYHGARRPARLSFHFHYGVPARAIT